MVRQVQREVFVAKFANLAYKILTLKKLEMRLVYVRNRDLDTKVLLQEDGIGSCSRYSPLEIKFCSVLDTLNRCMKWDIVTKFIWLGLAMLVLCLYVAAEILIPEED